MNPFSFVLCLPEAVFAQVLVDWLPMKAVARLDSAFCTHSSRELFLDGAYRRIQGTYKGRVRHWNHERQVQWYVTRGVPVDGMDLCGVLLRDNSLRKELLTSQGSRWRWVTLTTNDRDSSCLLIEIARWCPNLRRVNISVGNMRNCDDCFAELTAACQSLESLTVHYIFTTDGLAKTLANCRALRYLHVTCECAIPEEVAIPTLETLSVNGSLPEAVVVAIGARCPNLQVLHIFCSNCLVTDGAVRAVLQGCPKLRNTDIKYAERVSNEVRVQLFLRDRRDKFDMGDWYGLTPALDLLSAWPHLKHLHCKGERANGAMNDATLAACGAHCPQIEEVYIENSEQITNQGVLALLRPGNHLQCVWLRNCPLLSEAVVLAIGQNCSKLTYCDLSYMDLTDASVVQLAEGCPELESVTLDWTDVGDAGVTALAQRCKSLAVFSLLHRESSLTMAGVHALAQHARQLENVTLPYHFASCRGSADWPQLWASRRSVNVKFEDW